MKKNITIKNIDVDLYNQIKQRAEAEAVSVSDFITSLFTKELSETTDKDQSEKIEKYIAEIQFQREKREKALEELESFKKENNLLKSNLALRTEIFESSQRELEATKQKLKVTEEEIEAYKDQEEQILTITSGEIRVPFDELELALLNFVCERETQRVNNEITPEKLLNKMFVNHAVKGDMYFFKQPTRAEINQLKENLEKQKEYGEE